MTERDEGAGAESVPEESFAPLPNPWMRGLVMLVVAILMRVAEIVIVVAAILQFGWMVFARRRNAEIAAFGDAMGKWLAKAARFLSGASEEKPFPWSRWGE